MDAAGGSGGAAVTRREELPKGAAVCPSSTAAALTEPRWRSSCWSGSRGGDRFDRGEILPDRDRQASAIEAWQAERALYHAVRFHEGTE